MVVSSAERCDTEFRILYLWAPKSPDRHHLTDLLWSDLSLDGLSRILLHICFWKIKKQDTYSAVVVWRCISELLCNSPKHFQQEKHAENAKRMHFQKPRTDMGKTCSRKSKLQQQQIHSQNIHNTKLKTLKPRKHLQTETLHIQTPQPKSARPGGALVEETTFVG